ncbi:MAG: CopG family transcriptional regulator [Ruminococcus sp.]|nr:CopG family transcriptional regulator [Ruminococcus sp.]
MSKPMGRPKAENPKSLSLNIRLDAETEKKLQIYCKEHKISKGEAVRQGIHLLYNKK